MKSGVGCCAGKEGFSLRKGGKRSSKQWPCLDAKYFSKFHYAKRRFSVTSKYRHMHGVLNVDEIKN
jgi:hypothetical protein